MSAIRPPVPSPLFPTQSPVPPARASRSDFFRTALQGAMATTDEPVDPEAARASRAEAAPAGERHQRPGALLDIRV